MSLVASPSQAYSRPTVPLPPQAGMGITSFVFALISLANIILMMVVITTAHASFEPDTQEDSPFHYMLGTWTFVIGLLCICGIVFGIGGIRQKNRRHSLAIAGLCLNIAIPLGLMFILLLALTLVPPTVVRSSDDITDPNAWHSPLAKTFQCLTVVLALGVGWVFWKKHVDRTTEDSVTCPACQKRVPLTSKFCRRCGVAMGKNVDDRTGVVVMK